VNFLIDRTSGIWRDGGEEEKCASEGTSSTTESHEFDL
jgi:hypothetical protein